MCEARRPRVVVVGAGVPADMSHLERAASDVDLTLFHSRWEGGVPSPDRELPLGIGYRAFDPVVKSKRGHLQFVFPGLNRALDEVSPDLVHVIAEPWALFSAQVASWRRRNPTSRYVGHGCDTIWHHGGRAEQFVRRALLRYTLPVMDAFLAENTKALDVASASGLPVKSVRKRIHTNPRNAHIWRRPTGAERERARALLGLRPDIPAIGLICRLVPEKGIREFVDTAKRLRTAGFRGQFLVAGAGPLEGLVRDSEMVTHLGSLAHPAGVLDLVRALDVITCPSLSTPGWEDQGPRVLLEAAMAGCIPVGSDTGGIPEMLGTHGVLCDMSVSEDLDRAVRVAADRATADAERERVARWAAATYSGTAVGEALTALWTSLVDPARVADVDAR